MASDAPLTLSLLRFSALLAALRAGPLNRHTLLERLGPRPAHRSGAILAARGRQGQPTSP